MDEGGFERRRVWKKEGLKEGGFEKKERTEKMRIIASRQPPLST